MVFHRLRPLSWILSTGALGASAALVVACTGQVSNGKVTTTSQAVSPSAISSAPTPCESGFAHPNACCETGPNQATQCVVYPEAPFTECANGSTTYPDPRSCCPLDGNGRCAAPPPVGTTDAGTGGGGGSGGGGTCAYACPVGWYEPPASATSSSSSSGGPTGSTGATCCQTFANGAGACMSMGSGGSTGSGASSSSSSGGTVGSGCACACPACDTDGSCPPCPPCNCPAEPSGPSCDACPAGWQAPQGQPLLCCQDQGGVIACFSQGVPPSPPVPQDAGSGPTPPTSCFGGGGGSADGGPTFTQCGCSETVNGIEYTATCTDPGGTCVCTVGSSSTGTTVTEPASSCNDAAALFAACGFPGG